MTFPMTVLTFFLVSASWRIGLVTIRILDPAIGLRVTFLAIFIAVTLESFLSIILKVSKS